MSTPTSLRYSSATGLLESGFRQESTTIHRSSPKWARIDSPNPVPNTEISTSEGLGAFPFSFPLDCISNVPRLLLGFRCFFGGPVGKATEVNNGFALHRPSLPGTANRPNQRGSFDRQRSFLFWKLRQIKLCF